MEVLPTPQFYYGMQKGDEIAVELEPGKTLEKAVELANNIAKNAQIPNYLIVQAIPRIEDMSASDGMWTESVAQAVSMTSEDARAGIDAFFNKRKIEF